MTELTLKRAVELVEAAVAEKGADYLYDRPQDCTAPGMTYLNTPTCLYVHGSEPGCIVGNALHRFGVPLETLVKFEGRPVSFDMLDSVLGADYEDNVASFLRTVQCEQDEGKTWGKAVAYSKSWIESRT